MSPWLAFWLGGVAFGLLASLHLARVEGHRSWAMALVLIIGWPILQPLMLLTARPHGWKA